MCCYRLLNRLLGRVVSLGFYGVVIAQCFSVSTLFAATIPQTAVATFSTQGLPRTLFAADSMSLECIQMHWSAAALKCVQGQFSLSSLPEPLSFTAIYRFSDRATVFDISIPQSGALKLIRKADRSIELQADQVDLDWFASIVPLMQQYGVKGKLSARMMATPVGARQWLVQLEADLEQGAFTSQDGMQAGEKLRLHLSASAEGQAEDWRWDMQMAWKEGETYIHPLYLKSGPVLQLHGVLQQKRLKVEQANLRMEGFNDIAAGLTYDLSAGVVEEAAMAFSGLDLQVIGPRFLASLIDPARRGRIRFAGELSGGLFYQDGQLRSADLVFANTEISVAPSQLALGPINGLIVWQDSGEGLVELNVDGGAWGKLALQHFAINADLSTDTLKIKHLDIPVLSSHIVFNDLLLQRVSDGWRGAGRADIKALSMAELSEALEWPKMTGELSGSIPNLKVEPAEIVMDGALKIDIFDGRVQVDGLRVLDPFGVTSRLYGNFSARGMDLFKLTQTFSFGSIEGIIDMDLNGLELLHWQPVRFDAQIRSAPGSYRKRISQRAVENISALGGAGAIAALQRGILSIFDSFGYRRLGIGCKLRQGVCYLSGVEGPDKKGHEFILVEGGGVPALSVIGYNREVDWQELIARLKRAMASNQAPVVE